MPDTDTIDAAAAPAAAPAPAAAAPAPGPAPAPAPAPAASAPAPAPAAPAAPPADAPGFWAEGWRERLAAGDEKALKQLGRYGSPEDIWKKSRELEAKVTSGALKPVLGKDAKPEEVAEYRKALGVPESPDKYVLKDVKIEEAEKPFIGKLMEAAHSSNQTPEQVAATITTWNAVRTAALEKQANDDAVLKTKSEDVLRSEWGTDYRRNLNLVHGLLDGSGDQALKDNLLSGRLADGTPIGSSPIALKLLLGIALRDNPAGVIVPAGQDPIKGVEQRKAEIEKMMKENRNAYNKDEKVQAEYRQLIEAETAMKRKA